MKRAVCPCCKKGVQNRHLYMVSLPATVICTGCGSWLTVDVKNGGSLPAAITFIGILVFAFFWPPALILLPLTLLISFTMGQRFSVEASKKGEVHLWTIDRETGEIQELPDYKPYVIPQKHEVVGNKLRNLSPFKSLPEGIKRSANHKIIKEIEEVRAEIETDTVLAEPKSGPERPHGLPH